MKPRQIPTAFQARSKTLSRTHTLLLTVTAAISLGHPQAQASVWANATSGGLWSDDFPTGWNGTGVPNSNTAIADFTTLDIAADNTVHLDGSYQVNKLLFADATTASNNWIVDNNADPLNILTLSGTTPTIQVNNQTATISAEVAGLAGLTKTGGGVLELSSTANNYTGTTSVQSGTVRLTGSLSSATNVSLARGTFEYNKAAGTQSLTDLTLAGGYNVLVGTAGTLTFTGSVTRNPGSMASVPTTANFKFTGVATNTFMPGLFNGGAANNNTTFEVIDATTKQARAKNYTTDDGGANFQTANTGPFAEIEAANADKHIMIGSGTIAGGLAITAQPTISIKTLYNAYHSTAITILSDNVMTISDGFILNGRDQTLTINGGALSNNDRELFIRSSRTSKDVNIGSKIIGTGGLSVSGTGATGVGVQLNSANDFTGDTRSVQGVSGLSLNHALALQYSTVDMNADDSGPLIFKLAAHTLGGLKGARNLTLPATSLTVGGNDLSTNYSGVLSKAGAALIKTGSGTLTLTGINTYTGATSVNVGTLALSGSGSIADSTDISIQSSAFLDVTALAGWTLGSGQTLKGTGTLVGATSTSGIVAPGASVGTLNVTGDFTFATGSSLNAEIGVGLAQVETATALGTAIADGDIDVIVTGDGISGSPVTLNVAITTGDTPEIWAAAVRAALAGNAAITALYAVGGSAADITLTRLTFAANDPTLNLGLATGAVDPGITPAAFSADTTAGAVPTGTDQFVVSGALDVSGATLNLAITGTLTAPAYVIATYGSLTGSPFADINPPLPDGYELDYTYNSNTAIAIKQTSGGGDTYADWLGLNPPATGFDTDSDNDGIPNGIENILGTDPNNYSAGLTQIAATATSVTFQHPLNPAVASDVTRSYQWSTDLTEWKASGETNTGGTIATITPSVPLAGVVTVPITITSGPAATLFGRLVATKSP